MCIFRTILVVNIMSWEGRRFCRYSLFLLYQSLFHFILQQEGVSERGICARYVNALTVFPLSCRTWERQRGKYPLSSVHNEKCSDREGVQYVRQLIGLFTLCFGPIRCRTYCTYECTLFRFKGNCCCAL